jgi:WD40 repeat protein
MSGGILPGAEGGEPIVQDNYIHLFDVNIFASGVGGAFLNTLSGHTDAVTGLAFSPDGTHLISIAYDSTLRLWGVSDSTTTQAPVQQPTVAFSAQPQTVALRDSVTLSWSVENVGGIVITRPNPEARVDIPVTTDRRTQGSFTFTLSDPSMVSNGGATFYLSALDNNGNPVNAPGFPQVVTIAVTQPGSGCSHTFFFGVSGDCVDSQPADIPGAYQYFEGGYMLWHSARNSIIVLHSDNTVQTFPDTWNGQIGIRDRLGWALGAEQAYTMRWQSGHVDSPDVRPAGVEYYQWHTGAILRLTYYDGATLWNWV